MLSTWNSAHAMKYKSSLDSAHRTYLTWCAFFGFKAVPALEGVLMMYVRTLADSGLKYGTIKNYMSAVRTLHKMHGVEAPATKAHYHYSRVLQGIKREIGGTVRQKLHLTPKILLTMYDKIDWQDRNEKMFFAASLLAFYTFFRKSNFTCETEKGFAAERHLRRKDVVILHDRLIMVESQWSKTNQFQERLMRFPIVGATDSRLDAVARVTQYFWDDPAPADGPAFRVWKGKTKWVPLTGNWFVKKLKEVLLRCGIDATLYSGHSFRSGGATWAYSRGVPAEFIKLQGDWTSDAYLRYLRLPLEDRVAAAALIAKMD